MIFMYLCLAVSLSLLFLFTFPFFRRTFLFFLPFCGTGWWIARHAALRVSHTADGR